MHAGGTLKPPRLTHHMGQFPAGDSEVNAQLDGRREVARFGVQPGQDGRFNARLAQFHGFGDVRDAKPGGSRFQRGPGYGHGTVSVAVSLDHCHDPRGARDFSDMPYVVPHRGEVDVYPPLGHGTC